LDFQRRAIESSCKAFDQGERWEALRLATATHTIVHDGGKKNVSILTQLDVRGSLRFIASNRKNNPKNLLRETLLVHMQIGADGSQLYLPNLDSGFSEPRLLQFNEWWERDIIFQEGEHTLSRKRLVFTLRSQEGGAHFDPELRDPTYVHFARQGLTTPLVLRPGVDPAPMIEAELASMRQVAWELLNTLDSIGKNEA
jgi:hypothetical protein